MARFFSWFQESEADGRNFFAQQLNSYTVYYCFPPPSLISASLLHFLEFGAQGLLLVPWWPSCSFWCGLLPDGVHFTLGVKSFLRFRPSGFACEEGFISGTFWGPVTFNMVCLEFDFLNVQESTLGVPLLKKTNCVLFGCACCS